MTAETCGLCHGNGAIVDSVANHQRMSDDRILTGSITITGVTFPAAAPIRPVVTFTLRDQQGNPVAGMTVVRFTIAKLVVGANGDNDKWVPYKYNGDGEPTYERGRITPNAGEGTLVDNGSGNYTYTFALDLSTVTTPAVTYEPTLTHRLGAQNDSSTNPPNLGTFRANGYMDVTPSPGNPSALLNDSRMIVSKAACNSCHGLLNIHGRRYEIGYCGTCHNPSLVDAANNNRPIDMLTMVHKLHMGASLPSVVAGGTYTIGNADFSDITFPNRIANCTVCHQGTQADNWMTKPTMQACTTCHDNISFVDPPPTGMTLHSGGALADNAGCAASFCHGPTASKSVANVHMDKVAAEAAKYAYFIDTATETTPGSTPKVIFQVYNPTGNVAYDLTASPGPWTVAGGASRLQVSFAWNMSEWTNAGNNVNYGQPAGVNALDAANRTEVACPAAAPDQAGKCYQVTSPVAIPATMTGSGMVAMDGHPAVKINAADAAETRIPVKNAFANFAITGSVANRRAVVDIAKCNNCHGDISLHGSNRQGSIEVCTMCHNANATDKSRRPTDGTPTADGKAEEAIDFKYMIHAIHGAEERGAGKYITVYGFGGSANTFSHVPYPNVLFNCTACHVSGTATALPLASQIPGMTINTGASTGDPTDNLRVTKNSALCSSCHATGLASSHMQQMGGVFYGVTQAQIDAVQ